MKIIFMGTPKLALPVLDAIHQSSHTVTLVVTQPDRPAGRGRKASPSPVKIRAQELELPVLQPHSLKEREFLHVLESQQVDLIVVVAFSILPLDVINVAHLGAINLHASLLPKYRGAAPIQWAIYHGEVTTGATIFQLDAKMDTGAILAQSEVSITNTDTTATLGPRIVAAGTKLILRILDELESGIRHSVKQDNSLATPARKLKKQDGVIQWNRTVQDIHNHIRAFNPYPICYSPFTELGGKILRIHSATPTNLPTPGPGKLCLSPRRELLAGCRDFCIQLHTIQLEGKPRIDSHSFINGISGHTNLKSFTAD